MGFQIDGLDWLMNKWYNLTSVILADDMGLGRLCKSLRSWGC
jgi:SNF2 family DNA or RNA helicase